MSWFSGRIQDWLNARDARRMLRRQSFPESIERTYWNQGEFTRDAARLRAAGYEAASESESDPVISSTIPAGGGGVMGNLDRTVERRVPSLHVIYRRTQTPD